MGKYSASVRFEVLEFEADSVDVANDILNEMIDDLAQVDTAVGWDNVDLNLPGIDTDKIYHKSCAQLFGYKDLKDYADRPPNQHVRECGHPNELGHELIAQTLYNWITEPSNVQSKI